MLSKLPKREVYGYNFPPEFDQLQIELWMFLKKIGPELGGLGRLGHYRNICEILWPEDKYSEWADRMHAAFCGDSIKENEPLHVCVTGPAAAGKSTEAARFAVVWMLAAPDEFAVPVTSTSLGMSRRRIWKEIKDKWQRAKTRCRELFGYDIPGHLVDSSAEIQAVKGDSAHAIAIVPGSQSYLTEGVKKLQGWHARYVLIIADELQDMTKEVIDSCVNMASGTIEFIFIGLGNGQSWLNTFGICMMPKNGNPDSVDVEMEQWETADGICIHFDGLKSPNILNPGPIVKGIRQDSFPYLQNQSQIDKVVARHGENSIEYWQMVRGFPPPDDSYNAVVSESLLIKFHALKQVQFVSSPEVYAGLDPAFGGDGCVLKFANVGTFKPEEGEVPRMGILATERVDIKVVASKTQPLEFQIAEQVIELCKSRGVRPENFAGDGTGTGRGVLAVIRERWSNAIHTVEFGGGASDMPVSNLDGTKGKDAYYNSVTELYFSMKTFVINGQARGLTAQMARGFGCRTYITEKAKSRLSSKLEARKILGRSPDEEDAFVCIVDNLRRQGFFAGPLGYNKEWWEAVKEAASLDAQYAATDDLLIA